MKREWMVHWKSSVRCEFAFEIKTWLSVFQTAMGDSLEAVLFCSLKFYERIFRCEFAFGTLNFQEEMDD